MFSFLHLCPERQFTSKANYLLFLAAYQMSPTLQRENVCRVWLYHQSARLIKLDSLFAVVVTEAAWSGEIIFFFFARLVNSVSLQFFHPPAFCLCLRLSFLKLPNSLVSLNVFSSLSFKLCHCVWLWALRILFFLI